MILCDGCQQNFHPSVINIFMFNGAQVRYCQSCSVIWQEFDKTCMMEEKRRQQLYDLWIAEARDKVNLAITPYDFPKMLLGKDGQPVVL